MPAKRIYCVICNKYLGEIRDATLRKGIVYLCRTCSKNVSKEQDDGGMLDNIRNLFGMRY